MVSFGLSTHRTEVVDAVIPISTAVSQVIDIGHYAIAGLIMPAAWTGASIGFLVSDTIGGTLVKLFDDDGNQVEVEALISQGIGIDTDALVLAPWRFIQLQSVTIGTPATPIVQAAERTIKLVLKAP